MSWRWMFGPLMVLCGTCAYVSPALGGVAPGVTIEKEIGVDRSAPFRVIPRNTNRVNRVLPTFQIGPVSAGSSFQPCAGLSGYVGTTDGTSELARDRFTATWCATGSVTIKQMKTRVDMAGKKVRLLLTNSHLNITPWTDVHDIYELAFQSRDTLVFGKVVFGSVAADNPDGWPDPTVRQQRETFYLDYANRGFSQGRPVKIGVLWDGTSAATLNCTFTSPAKISCP